MKIYLKAIFCLIFVFTIFSTLSFAQLTGVDTSFHAVPSNSIPIENSLKHLVQPDGKIVIWGASLVADGVAKGEIIRLNADGSLDQTFSFCGCDGIFFESVALLPNGQFLVAGSISQTAKMIRLNSDGSTDYSYVSGNPPNPFGYSSFNVVGVQPDGKAFATRYQTTNGFVEIRLYRFNQDGSVDSSFSPIFLTSGSPAYATVSGMIFLPDGRFYLAVTQGTFSVTGSLKRYNSNGTADSTWETPSFTSESFGTPVYINGISLEASGSIVVAGRWVNVNGLMKPNLIRLFSAGNVDINFSPVVTTVSRYVTGVKSLPTGKILYSQIVDSSGTTKLYRLNSDGTSDNTFTMDSTIDSVKGQWSLDSSGRIVFFGLTGQSIELVRLSADGQRDLSFTPNLTVFGKTTAIARQTDNKLIVAGSFSQMNGTARPKIARTDSEGNLDTTFDPGTGFSSAPKKILVQPDGKIIAIGSFSTYNGTARASIARINSNGTLDASFAPTVTNLEGITLQSDGKIIISGSFTTVNGTARTRVARLEANGDLDNSFNPTIGSGVVYRTIAQSDGKILVGGSFSGVNGFNRSNLVRLNADGSLDQTFNATSTSVTGLWRQPDGKYIIASSFNLARKNADGSNDSSFVSLQFSNSSNPTFIDEVLVNADGSLIVGGYFQTIGGIPRQNLTRLRPNGELDGSFLVSGVDDRVTDVISAGNSKILIGGDFTKVGFTSQPGISRLIISPLRSVTQFDFDGDGRADISVFRPSENRWYILRSSDGQLSAPVFGTAGDVLAPADFDGDGKTDIAIFRPAEGGWWYQSSINNLQYYSQVGQNGDIPRPSDFDGDGKSDYVAFTPTNNYWTRVASSTGQFSFTPFGSAGDKPLIGDFNGDGKSDLTIYRPSTGTWWWKNSVDNIFYATQWGNSTDIPAPADYDGDGKTDFAVYRPSEGIWYIFHSAGTYNIVRFGLAEDKPVPADYDGDGKSDIAVFRPSTGVWYLLKSTEGFAGLQFGLSTDIPIPNSFIPQ